MNAGGFWLVTLTGILNFKVITQVRQAQERIVLSERAALAGEGKRRVIFGALQEGAILTGKVTNVTDFGVFIDLGGVEGLIHVSELSWGRVRHFPPAMYYRSMMK